MLKAFRDTAHHLNIDQLDVLASWAAAYVNSEADYWDSFRGFVLLQLRFPKAPQQVRIYAALLVGKIFESENSPKFNRTELREIIIALISAHNTGDRELRSYIRNVILAESIACAINKAEDDVSNIYATFLESMSEA